MNQTVFHWLVQINAEFSIHRQSKYKGIITIHKNDKTYKLII
jgi:hypothetical protein